MHVHVNRNALSPLALGKTLVFINSAGNTALIRRVAQRDAENWARRYPKRVADGKNETSNKYEALHLSSRTVEFRIFRGNLRFQRVLKNIEFCHSVVKYCESASMRDLDSHAGYLAWLGKNRGTYPNLVRFLGETYGFKDTAKNLKASAPRQLATSDI
jgi:hypothetical protein